MSLLLRMPIAIALAVSAPAAQAEVFAEAANGFVIRQSVDVAEALPAVWAQLLQPAEWWNPLHSYSGDARNLAIDARVGGCFCETLPALDGAESPEPRGGVEHMRVIYIEANRALRMSGALGPLQAEAAQGTLSIVLKPEGEGVRIMWEYVVGGYMRQKIDAIAPAVDGVLGAQLTRLAARIEGRDVSAMEAAPKSRARPPVEQGR